MHNIVKISDEVIKVINVGRTYNLISCCVPEGLKNLPNRKHISPEIIKIGRREKTKQNDYLPTNSLEISNHHTTELLSLLHSTVILLTKHSILFEKVDHFILMLALCMICYRQKIQK